MTLVDRTAQLYADLRKDPDVPLGLAALAGLVFELARAVESVQDGHASYGGEIEGLGSRIEEVVNEMEGKIRDEISAHVDDEPHLYPDGSS